MNKLLSAGFVFLLFITNQAKASSLSVRCAFTGGQVTDFDKGKASTKRTNDLGELIFDQIDVTARTARMIGNQGAESIIALRGDDSIHLLERTGSGNLNITTIFSLEEGEKLGSFPVVHSRHVSLMTGPLPSQYVGRCRRLQ
ncbi:MAG: hypothetical protein EBT15_05555 [Betaproteobacteria bacterium]|nr:hypothetical protein [Betaproteobacteria bacterium]